MPFVSRTQDTLVCPPVKQTSLIDGFENVTKEGLECKTNYFGQAAGQKCQSECR